MYFDQRPSCAYKMVLGVSSRAVGGPVLIAQLCFSSMVSPEPKAKAQLDSKWATFSATSSQNSNQGSAGLRVARFGVRVVGACGRCRA